MTTDCPIRIACSTKASLLELSIIKNADGKPCEPYDSIVRRAIEALKSKQNPKKINVSEL